MKYFNHDYSFVAHDTNLTSAEIRKKFRHMPTDDTVRISENEEAHEVMINFSTPRTARFKSAVHIWLEKFMLRAACNLTDTESYALLKCVDTSFDVIARLPKSSVISN